MNEGGYDVEVNSIAHGDVGYNLNGFWNLPLGDRAAVRLVAWHKRDAGFVDNVPTTMHFPGPQPHTIDNYDFVKSDFNESTTSGLRALLRVDLNENWTLTPGIMAQNSDDDDRMIYATWSEGFRAGGVNRARVEGIPKYYPDFVTNYEFGWKMALANGNVRFNGAIYQLDWDDFQFGFLDFTISNLTIVQNVGNSQTRGVEWDLTWAANDRNTLTWAGSCNDAKLKTDYWRLQEEQDAALPPNAPAGTPMPYVPEWQMTGIWRSCFDIASLPAFFQAAVSYTDSRWNDLDTLNVPARRLMDDYTLASLSAGIEKECWTLTLFVNNLTDERAQIDIEDPGYGGLSNLTRPPGHAWTTTPNPPRMIGVRFSQRF